MKHEGMTLLYKHDRSLWLYDELVNRYFEWQAHGNENYTCNEIFDDGGQPQEIYIDFLIKKKPIKKRVKKYTKFLDKLNEI